MSRFLWIGIALLALGCDVGSDVLLDFDGDGTLDADDCDPGDDSIFPGAPDPYGDDIDQDCDAVDGVDYDGDGYPAPGAGVPTDLEDCNDADASIYPGADDPVDATDQDCDGFSRPLELTLTPLEPRTSDNLELRVTTDAVIYDVNWSVNGQPRTEFSGFETITSAQTTKGDVWGAEVIAYADGGRSSLPTTVSATILNSPPGATLIVGLEPDPREGDTLSAAATIVDDDGDTGSISFIWLVNGVQVNVESLEQLTSADFDKGDEIWAELIPHDGEEPGAAIETNHVFAINTAPSALNAVLDPSSGGEDSTFSCLVSGWTDPDPADSESYEIQWYVNEGASLTTVDLDGSSFDRGDTVRCEATPNDGEETGASLASGVVTIANTLPALSAVTLDPSAGDEETTFTCQPTGWLDPDPADSSPIYQYQWYVGAPGSEVASVTSETIDGSAFSSGDSIYCEVTPINEFGGSLPAEAGAPVLSSAVVVANSVPQIDSVSIEPAGAATVDHLGVSVVGWTDADGDSPDYLYQWWIDPVAGSLVDGGTAATLDWSVTQRGDEITVEVTPTDGIDSGTMVVGGPITIANTLPGAPVVVIDPSVPSTIDALTCSIATASLDPDFNDGNDSVSYDLSWYEGGNHQPAYDVSGGDATITSVVPASATAEGEVWTCEVTPSDGEGSGAVGTASATPDPTCPSHSFDGIDDHIEMDATLASLLTLGEYWTSEAWFRIDSAPSATAAVFGTTCQWFGAFVGTTGLIRGYRWGSTAGWLEGTTHVADGQWHHVALVVEDGAGGSSNETRLYLDGQLEASDAGGSDMDSQALSEWLLLGANAGDCNSASGPSNLQEYFGGDINSFRHSADQRYDEAFTPEPLLEDDSITVLLWGADSDANGLIDHSGNGHTGTVVGAAALSGCPSEDVDLDGFASWQDCDDDNDQIYPQAGDTYDDGVDSDCDGLDCGGYPYEGGYYVFCPELKTREDAQSSCESADMDLVSVFGSDELDFVFTTVVNTVGWGGATPGPWIGLQDADLDGTFQWQDGAPMTYENWCNGQPVDPGNRAYVQLEVNVNANLPSVPCWSDNGSWQTVELEYVCESRHCGPEALEAGETCLSTRDFRAGEVRYLARETGWGSADDEADSFCAAHGYSGGGRVVWPANEDDYVYSYNATPGGIYDGHTAPNIEIQREVGCFRTDADGDGVDSTDDCNDNDPGVAAYCPTCPDGGGYSYNGHDYAFCPIAVDRDSAAAECADMGAHLVKIEDAAENAWLWSTALTEFTSGPDDPWLGANRIATSDWVWHDGTALSPFFPQNQPSATGDWSDSNRQCLVMVMNTTSSQSTDSFWHPKSCDNDFPYVCEVAIDADGDGVLSDVDCDDNNDSIYPGSDSSCPGTSCLQLLEDDLSEGDGSYWIDPENTGAFEVTCDMTTDGGGWTALTSDVLGSLNDRSGGRQYLYSNSVGWAVSPATNLAWDWNSWAVLSGDYDYGSAGNPASGTFSCSHTNVEYGDYGVGCVETGGPSGWKLYPAGSSANYDSTIGTALICQDFPGSLGSGCVADVQIWFRESDASAHSCSSLAFDNTNNALTSSFTIPSGGYTVEAWVWLNDVGPQPILSSSNMNLGVYGGNDGLVVQYPGHSDLTATNEAVPMNQWTHLVWAYSGSGGMQAANWDFFIDGVLSTGEVRQGASEPPLSGNTVELGSFTAHNCCLTDLDGQLRSIRVSSGLRYSTGFTPIAELDSDSSTLVLWDFDGAESGVIADLSGNGYEVTPSSNMSWSATCPEEDGDSDGVAVWQDCDDSDPEIYPWADDTYGDGVESNCDGMDCEASSDGTSYFAICPIAADWSTGLASCQAAGYDGLASILDSDTQSFAESLTSGISGSHYWIGYNDIATEGTWEWDSGFTSGYDNFCCGEPNNGGGTTDQDCAWMGGANYTSAGSWFDDPCGITSATDSSGSYDIGFMCERLRGFTYSYLTSPSPLYSDSTYDGSNGELNDGVIGTSWGVPPNNSALVGWQNSDPEFVVTPFGGTIDTVRVSVLGDNVGGVTLPSVVRVFDQASGVELAQATPAVSPLATGWVEVSLPGPTSSALRVLVERGGEWSQLAEVSVAPCSPGSDSSCPGTSCLQLLNDDDSLDDGTYWIDPDDDGLGAFEAYCDMNTDGGGWTLLAVNGTDGRPGSWSGNSYPRPGASSYGTLNTAVSDLAVIKAGNTAATNYSIDAASLYLVSTREVLAYVGGTTTDFVTTTLPDSCNFFDGDTFCQEDTYTGLTVYHSDGSVLTTNGQACTTANNTAPWTADMYDEFGLHLLDGTDSSPNHCHATSSSLGLGSLGRIYTTFNNVAGQHWSRAVLHHWNDSGVQDQPGFLLLR